MQIIEIRFVFNQILTLEMGKLFQKLHVELIIGEAASNIIQNL